VRGLATLTMLGALTQGSGFDVSELFDLIAGVSTGGLIGISLGAKVWCPDADPLERITSIYRDFPARVFSKDMSVGKVGALISGFRYKPSTATCHTP